MGIRLGIKRKFLFFLAGYTLLLCGGMLVYFLSSGYQDIRLRSRQEIIHHSGVLSRLLQKEVQDCAAELTGFRTTLVLTAADRTRMADVSMQLIQEYVASFPYKYAAFMLVDLESDLTITFRPVMELGEIQLLHQQGSVSADLAALGRRCLAKGTEGTIEPELELVTGADNLRFFLPVGHGNPGKYLAVDVFVDFLVSQSVEKLALPPEHSLLVANGEGVILQADDMSHLHRRLNNVFAASTEIPDRWAPQSGWAEHEDALLYWSGLPQLRLLAVLRKDLAPELRQWWNEATGIFIFILFMVVLAMGGIWYLSERIARPVGHVAEVARRVAAGDFTQKIMLKSQDELGVLIESFNDMTDKLQLSYRELQTVNRELAAKIRELSRARQELSRKERLALLGEAISKISHEIQNKISGVSVWVQNLERYTAEDERAQLYIQELKGAQSAFLDMLVDFKRFYREPLLEKERVHWPELLDASLRHLRLEIESKELRVVREGADDLVAVQADSRQLTDAMVNILLNAVYFSPPGGRLHLQFNRRKKWVILSVNDEGPGIPADSARHLFTPFYSTKPSGSGLGLAIVHNIVRAHGGRLRARNRRGSGACFEIWLPGDES